MKNYFDILRNTPLFSGIDKSDIESLIDCLSITKKTYRKNEMIFIMGQKITSVGLVYKGNAQIIKEDFLGNRTILMSLENGALFGEAFACANTECLPVSVIAKEDSEIIFIDYHKIITTCSESCIFHNKIINNMIKILANKNIMLNQKIEVISQRTTRDKLMAFLSIQSVKMGSHQFSIHFNRQELADYLCVERSAMSVEISKMQKEGLIKTNKNYFELLG